MKRVINNIVGNAVKYLGKASGKITMNIKEYKKQIQISISDDGVGIAEKDLPFILILQSQLHLLQLKFCFSP